MAAARLFNLRAACPILITVQYLCYSMIMLCFRMLKRAFTLFTIFFTLPACTCALADTAMDHYRRGMALEEQGDAAGAISAYLLAVDADATFTDAYFLLGRAEVRSRRFADAETHLNRALGLMPGNIKAQAWLGALYLKTGRPDQALDLLRQAHAANPGDPSILVRIGDAQRALDKFREARDFYIMALEKDPAYGPAFTGLGLVLEKKNDPDQAMDMYLRALAADESDAVAHLRLAYIFYHKSMKLQAGMELRRAEALLPGDPEALSLRAAMEADSGDPARAADLIEASIRDNPKDAALYVELARMRRRAGDYAAAGAALDTARALKPGDADAYTEAAALFEDLGRFDDAVLFMNTAVRLQPRNAGMRHKLALLYNAAGDTAAAREHLRIALDLGLKDSPLLHLIETK